MPSISGGSDGGGGHDPRRSFHKKTSLTSIAADVPPFSDDSSMRSSHLSVDPPRPTNPNARLRGDAENFRNSNDTRGGGGRGGKKGRVIQREESVRSVSSGGSRGSRGSTQRERRSSGRGGSRAEDACSRRASMERMKQLAEADQIVDMPHLDDMLWDSANSQEPGKDSADVAAGGKQNARRAAPDRPPRSGGKGRGRCAIVVEDEENAPGLELGPDRRSRDGEGGPSPPASARSLNLEMPTLSELNAQSARSSSLFENLWGPNDAPPGSDDERRSLEVDGDAEYGPSRFCDASSHSHNSSTQSMKLMRAFSGRLGFTRSPPLRYHGDYDDGERSPNNFRDCRALFRRRIKTTVACILLSVGFAVTVGMLVVMVPIWMESGERGESDEMEGLAQGDSKGEILSNDGGAGTGGGGGSMMERGKEDADGSAPATPESTGAGVTGARMKLKSPPSNLQLLCSRNFLEECAAACLPSQCCHVPVDDPYKVWKPLPHFALGSTVATELPIGAEVTSCLAENPETCASYHKYCGVLGDSGLLPRKPPDVASMTATERLALAERVYRSCNAYPLGEECQGLCHGKECCFVEEEERRTENDDGDRSEDLVAGALTGHPLDDVLAVNVTQDLSFHTGPANFTNRTDQQSTNVTSTSSSAPNEVPSSMPTSSQRPTPVLTTDMSPPGTGRRWLLAPQHQRNQRQRIIQEFGHMTIPGEEDFIYFIPEDGAMEDLTNPYDSKPQPSRPNEGDAPPSDGGGGSLSELKDAASTNEDVVMPSAPIKNCLNDPGRHCMTYAGCAPIFGK